MKKERREEERKILAQMDEAMKENQKTDAEKPQKYVGPFRDKTPETIHCRKCSALMENGKCPNCGHTVYVPMDGKKQKIIRWVVGGVCLLAFLVVFILTR